MQHLAPAILEARFPPNIEPLADGVQNPGVGIRHCTESDAQNKRFDVPDFMVENWRSMPPCRVAENLTDRRWGLDLVRTPALEHSIAVPRLLEKIEGTHPSTTADTAISKSAKECPEVNQYVDPAVLSDVGTLEPAAIGETIPLHMATGKAAPSLHLALRAATQEVHGRLHRHAGFAAVQDATIGLADYKALIVRLYGFYVPFEAAMALEPERSLWLAEDLAALDDAQRPHAVPLCRHVPRLDSAYLRLGARYVVEGSALGGRELARGLDPLLGKDVVQGRQFFVGRGAGTGENWRRYLAQVSAVPPEPAARAEIIKGATETFAVFEHWLNGWSTPSYG